MDKLCNNPYTNMYDIDFDLNNRWEIFDNKLYEGKYDRDEFFSLLKDSELFAEKYASAKQIPHSSLLLFDTVHELNNNVDIYIYNEASLGLCLSKFIYTLKSIFDDIFLDYDDEKPDKSELLLCSRWDKLYYDQREKNAFDEKVFCKLAVDTYNYILKYNDKKLIPRSMPMLMAILNDYSFNSYGYCKGDKKAFVAREIASTFSYQMINGLEIIEEDQNKFLIVDGCGSCKIDTSTFDLSKAVDHCPDWMNKD